jgi:MoaA/NifB/PqqE/SkfB family radical SAM enzyme
MLKLKGNNYSQAEVYEALKLGRLLTLTIFLENVCNFRCPFCLTQTRDFKKPLTTDETKAVVLDGQRLGARTVMIAGAGEPLMASNFWEIVEFVRGRGLDLIVFSNLSLVTEAVAKRLFEKDISIIGKLNSFKEDVQEEYVGGVKGAYARMRTGLRNLLELGYNRVNARGETKLSLETSILKQNVGEIFDYWVYCRENHIVPILDTVYYQGKATEHDYAEFLVDYDVIANVIDRIRRYDAERGYHWERKLLNRGGKGVLVGEAGIECVKIGTNLNVDIEGYVYDCFAMSGPGYGNVRDSSLADIWKAHRPHASAIGVHGLCKCRNYVDRDAIMGELACSAPVRLTT